MTCHWDYYINYDDVLLHDRIFNVACLKDPIIVVKQQPARESMKAYTQMQMVACFQSNGAINIFCIDLISSIRLGVTQKESGKKKQ